MKKSNLLLASILIGSLNVAGLGFAHACNGNKCDHHEEYRGDNMMHGMNKLDLSKEQRESIHKLKNESREQMQAQREKMMEIRKALKEQGSAKTFDENKVRELADAKSKIMTEMTVQRMKNMHQIRTQLTPEQLEKFDKMKEKMKDKHSDRDDS